MYVQQIYRVSVPRMRDIKNGACYATSWFFISVQVQSCSVRYSDPVADDKYRVFCRPAALRNERVLQGLVYVNIAAYLIFAVLRNLWYAGMQSRGSSVGYGSCADMPDISEQLHVCGVYLLWIADWLLFSINIIWPYKHICRGRYGKEYFNG